MLVFCYCCDGKKGEPDIDTGISMSHIMEKEKKNEKDKTLCGSDFLPPSVVSVVGCGKMMIPVECVRAS